MVIWHSLVRKIGSTQGAESLVAGPATGSSATGNQDFPRVRLCPSLGMVLLKERPSSAVCASAPSLCEQPFGVHGRMHGIGLRLTCLLVGRNQLRMHISNQVSFVRDGITIVVTNN